MTIDVASLKLQPLDQEIADELDRFEDGVARYLAGEIEDDAFRVFRLSQGIYGQRQGGYNQMVRVRVPHGKIEADHLEMIAYVVDNYSRGWAHFTTRQNIQFHFVQLQEIGEVLRLLASVGLTSREACGDTVRNVAGCHLAGACPFEVLDISAWAQATNDWFIRNPINQRMPRKFKINFSGCATDCGQAMFNDVGVIAVSRPLPDGTTEPGFRVFVAGGLGANPHPAQAIEEFTPRSELLATIEAALRVFDHHGNRDNKIRARMKWLVDTMGMDELRERILKERRFLIASATYPGGVPEIVEALGDAPAGAGEVISGAPGVQVSLNGAKGFAAWDLANVVRGRANGTVSAYAHCKLGDITSDQLRGLADLQRDFAVELRVTNRQNVVIRNLTEDQLPALHERLVELDMATPGAELVRDVVSCPGADTCNLAVTQSRGLAADIDRALDEAGLADVNGIRINISGCTNSCGQHHTADIGFFGLERRAHDRTAPGYQMLLGGHVGAMEIAFGQKATKVPAKVASQAVVRVVGRYATEREPGELFQDWLARSGGAAEVGKGLRDLDAFPTPDEGPEFYIDFDETGPYEASVGDSECRDVTALAPDLAELQAVNADLEHRPATAAIEWAADRFGDGLVLAASFQDCVLIDLASQVAPGVEVVFLDTQYHFAETLWYVDQVRARYNLNLRTLEPDVPRDDRWLADPDACCRVRKVEPMARALEGKDAWMTGLRRAETATRVSTPVVHYDIARDLVKVNPIATWTDADVAGYAEERELPVHPLADKGYASIGCWPCTRPVEEGEDPRAGRWSDFDKRECGLHS